MNETGDDVRVFVHAPHGHDAIVIAQALVKWDITTEKLDDPEMLVAKLRNYGGILVCSQEGLTFTLRDRLLDELRQKPSWLRLPIILLVDGTETAEQARTILDELIQLANVVFIQRPMRRLDFTTVVRQAIADFRKQLQIRDHLLLQEELKNELQHRVKNTFATFMAICNMTLRQSDNLQDFRETFAGRMAALNSVHDFLQDSRDGERSLSTIIDVVLEPFADKERVHADGDECQLDRDISITLGLILNELVTNANKYGALSTGDGIVDLEWSVHEGTFSLDWAERSGPPVKEPTRQGYGSGFIRSSIAMLGGECNFDFDRGGLNVRIALPAEALQRHSPAREPAALSAAIGS